MTEESLQQTPQIPTAMKTAPHDELARFARAARLLSVEH
jgi:hypothetical protein